MDPELVELAQRVLAANRTAGRRIAVAESCTGGMVAAALTEIAGSSDVFERGFVAYSNEAKMELLDVSDDVLVTFGAVSAATAWAMAQGAIARSHADVAVSITGIAGPGGGSAAKPVGMVVFGRARRGTDQSFTDMRMFVDVPRAEVRRRAALAALNLLLPD